METDSDIKEKIIAEMLKDSVFDGWNNETLKKISAKITGKSETYAVFFENGIHDLSKFFVEMVNLEMVEEFEKIPTENMKIREKIRCLISLRLKILSRNKEAIRAKQGFFAMPQNLFLSNQLLWKVSDQMWAACRDQSVDFNYYSKRGLLSIIYSSCLNFWLNDDSQNHVKTEEFIVRAIDDVMKINGIKAKIPQILKKIPFLRLLVK